MRIGKSLLTLHYWYCKFCEWPNLWSYDFCQKCHRRNVT